MHLKTGYSSNKHSNQKKHLKQLQCRTFHQWRIEKQNFRSSKHISPKTQRPYSNIEKDGLVEITISLELILEPNKNEMKRLL